jgi:succinate dehydrogenase/fumarate reductase flavoprotein subunit
MKFGVKFKRKDGELYYFHDPGQTYPRSLQIVGAGFGLISGLAKELHRHSRIRIYEDVCVSRLLTKDGKVIGAFGLNLRDGLFYAVLAKSVILACGGYQELWGNTDTGPDLTGDGLFLGFDDPVLPYRMCPPGVSPGCIDLLRGTSAEGVS